MHYILRRLSLLLLSVLPLVVFPQTASRNIRQLYQSFTDAENEGRIDLLKVILQQSLRYLHNGKQLSPQDKGLLLTIAGQISQDAGDYPTALSYLETANDLCSREFGNTSKEALQAKECLSWAYSYNGRSRP